MQEVHINISQGDLEDLSVSAERFPGGPRGPSGVRPPRQPVLHSLLPADQLKTSHIES